MEMLIKVKWSILCTRTTDSNIKDAIATRLGVVDYKGTATPSREQNCNSKALTTEKGMQLLVDLDSRNMRGLH